MTLSGKCQIVLNIKTPDEIKEESWTAVTLIKELNTPESSIMWCAERRLLTNERHCTSCSKSLCLTANKSVIDKYQWRCKKCSVVESIRKKSVFQNCHLTILQIIIIMYFWSREYPSRIAAVEVEVSKKVAIDWYNFFRDICKNYFDSHPVQLGGLDDNGFPKVVEVDETFIFHKNHNCEQTKNDRKCVFGGIERDSRKCFLVEVPNRKAQTLFPIIEQYVLPGSRIISDDCSAYAKIGQINDGIYQHDSVHERDFVDGIDPEIHTQHIKNMWSRAKQKLKHQYYKNTKLFQPYLLEFQWRCLFKTHAFENFLMCVSNKYPC
ncbi:uncharacterized protein LOC111627794 [Centruroides sculpturatus]|uniref:uncharacterized protein LOC111627790 n=1 Tax=Centruroides sculpturatus TaxID=218467 RepID=UPI000C6D0F38|nr:uncharacterized protein LOC111627790 [Centruroides sculpturatus]XP_023227201.1 uncharacterized protein LOC111627791 [Centruroides sculpturatus]XP_023227204.1 uncharacterized protein LOC111627794 [Centruroides sculpturatus]XP_023227205.1 uncharacterized protein LOC111627794 [Centruroides sculpturatus]XP_023227206.1 uncharacterized protein LOC111627794 [Centruroides sculpturatus]